ncbi:hypothetical protein B296_00027559 [Ensete ventricosum]|uniref:Uncharacterized protein n=1 Tax=Ensete ventricosum TaxID=4639 RepID=A0A426Y5K8_ENSVE|nr:hypothetical protein B296_00027559 [Ensete ventricosum]
MARREGTRAGPSTTREHLDSLYVLAVSVLLLQRSRIRNVRIVGLFAVRCKWRTGGCWISQLGLPNGVGPALISQWMSADTRWAPRMVVGLHQPIRDKDMVIFTVRPRDQSSGMSVAAFIAPFLFVSFVSYFVDSWNRGGH